MDANSDSQYEGSQQWPLNSSLVVFVFWISWQSEALAVDFHVYVVKTYCYDYKPGSGRKQFGVYIQTINLHSVANRLA